MCKVVGWRLTGKAEKSCRSNPQTASFSKWNEVKQFLRTRVNPHTSEKSADLNFAQCTQNLNEFVDEYAYRFGNLADTAINKILNAQRSETFICST